MARSLRGLLRADIWSPITKDTPGSITDTVTGTERTGRDAMAGVGGTTLITAGAEITTAMARSQRRGEGRGATAATEARVIGTTTTITMAPPRRRPATREGEKNGSIATTTPIAHQRRETARSQTVPRAIGRGSVEEETVTERGRATAPMSELRRPGMETTSRRAKTETKVTGKNFKLLM